MPLVAKLARIHVGYYQVTFTLSSEQGEWIAIDASASNEVFNVDKALSIDNMSIVMPSGKSTRPSSSYKAHRKSVADYFIKDSGTYKITNNASASYFSSYKVADKRKRARANKAELKAMIPANATGLQTTYGLTRVETYITMNNPTENYPSDGQFLELLPKTHPAEIVEHEPATFAFTYHGAKCKPVLKLKLHQTVRVTATPLTY